MKKPNIIFVLIDDMGWKDLSCCGSTFYETPNIDKLGAEGMMFSNAYASCPVCSPSRASFLSGQYPARVGITDWIDHANRRHPCKGRLIDAPYLRHLPKDTYTIANALHDVGYATWHVGKWHVGMDEYLPEYFGFEENIGGCGTGSPPGGYFSPYNNPKLPDGPEGEYLTDRLTDEAIALIESGEERPFFLHMSHYTVHVPLEGKQADTDKFLAKAERLGLDIKPFEIGEEFTTEDKKGKHVVRRTYQSDPVYAGMIWNLDQNMGRLMDALERTGQKDNTIVVFTSDNGGLATAEGSCTCNAPASEGKGWVYEGGVRVPLIFWYPKSIPAGSTCDENVITMDFYNTFFAMIGETVPQETILDGADLSPLFAGNAIAPRPLFWHYPHYGNQGGRPSASVLWGNDKLIFDFESQSAKLFDLNTDIGEKDDIAAQHPEKVSTLCAILEKWQADIMATFPTLNDNYTAAK
ncbi:MAG: sulfatase [Faecalibacterium sp.]